MTCVLYGRLRVRPDSTAYGSKRQANTLLPSDLCGRKMFCLFCARIEVVLGPCDTGPLFGTCLNSSESKM